MELEIRRAAVARARGDSDALDGHALFCREKLAYALAILDRRVEIDSEDWRLAGIVAEVSDWWRARTVVSHQEFLADESRDRGQLRGVENAAAELGKTQEQVERVQRVLDKVIDKIKRSMPDGISTRDLTRKISGRDQGMVKGALDYLVRQGQIMQVEGTKVWVIR